MVDLRIQNWIGVTRMRMGWFLCGFICFVIGCGGVTDTSGDANDPATTTDSAAMTETDANAGNPPGDAGDAGDAAGAPAVE